MRKTGQTLIEIVVSMVYLGILIAVMVSAAAIVSTRPGKLSNLDQQGLYYAREIIEGLHNCVSTDPVRSAPLTEGEHRAETTADIPAPPAGLASHNPVATYVVTDVKDPPGGSTVCYKRVEVTVTWDD